MDLQRRRLAALEAFVPLITVLPRDGATTTTTMLTTATITMTTTSPEATVAPYDTDLNGVDQPQNMLFKDLLWWSLGIVALVLVAIRLLEILRAHLRQVSAMSLPGEKQTYWMISQWWAMPSLKRNIIYAPLGKKRHNREIRLSSALNIGTLPSRLHAILLGAYFVSNLIYIFWLDYSAANQFSTAAELRGRSGSMAAANMVPLVIFAGRNNPLIRMLKISFDTYNLLHRWMGRTVAFQILVHFAAWAYVQVADGGWASVNDKILHDPFIASGSAGFVAIIILVVISVSPIRHAFYETFLNTHIILAFIVIVGAWVHCTSTGVPGGIPQAPYIYAVLTLWLADRATRMVRLACFNWSRQGFTEATVEPMPGEACRVTLRLPKFVPVKPGTHAYLRFQGVNPWESHPFSIAWVQQHGTEADALPQSEKEPLRLTRPTSTTASFVIGAQTGFTRKLYNTARAAGTKSIALRAAFEGPYAGHHCLDSYGHIVLIAGATGITHQLSYLAHLIRGFGAGVVATRRLVLVWVVRDYDALEWVRPWMDEVLRLPRRKELLQIRVFITRPKRHAEVSSASRSVQMFPGRPNIPLMLRKEVHAQVGAMVVSVCGPGGLADDVRSAVRGVQDEGKVVDFIEEAFTW